MKLNSKPRGQPKASRFTVTQRVLIGGASLLGWALVWLIGRTLRYRIEGWSNFQKLKDQKRPIIYSFWHNQIFIATHFWRFRGIVVITSEHFDGEYIARIIERFGYHAARGSSRRGALKALLQLKRSIEHGRDVAFTVDGPSGPVYRVKPGPIWLSRKTGAPIVPFHVQPEKFWKLNSWDNFRIPKPFSLVLVKIGRPLSVRKENEGTAATLYQQEMDHLRERCEARWP